MSNQHSSTLFPIHNEENKLPFSTAERQYLKGQYRSLLKRLLHNLCVILNSTNSNNQQLATKSYLDNYIEGLKKPDEIEQLIKTWMDQYYSKDFSGPTIKVTRQDFSKNFSISALEIHKFLKNPGKLIEGVQSPLFSSYEPATLHSLLRDRIVRDISSTIEKAYKPFRALEMPSVKSEVWDMNLVIPDIEKHFLLLNTSTPDQPSVDSAFHSLSTSTSSSTIPTPYLSQNFTSSPPPRYSETHPSLQSYIRPRSRPNTLSVNSPPYSPTASSSLSIASATYRLNPTTPRAKIQVSFVKPPSSLSQVEASSSSSLGAGKTNGFT